jgi:hypothetical protein
LAKPNYRHQKQQREQAQRRKKESKLRRKLERKGGADPSPLDPKVDVPTGSA